MTKTEPKPGHALGQIAHTAYADAHPNTTTTWDDLSDAERNAWATAAATVLEATFGRSVQTTAPAAG